MRIRTLGTMVVGAAMLVACRTSDLDITNPNIVTTDGAAADPTAIQLLATGMLVDLRGLTTSQPSPMGIHGREAYNYTPTEGRNTSGFIIPIVVGGKPKLDPAGFSGALNWGTQYNALRDSYNFGLTIDGSTALTAARKSAANGFRRTIEGLALLQVVAAHDTIGGITEILENPLDLAPFVSRDSMYKWVIGTLDAAYAQLQAGGATFPFLLHAGFAGFNTPATYGQFNRAIRARAGAYYATAGGGAAAWQGTLTALAASFLNVGATTRAALDAGVYTIFSTAAGDATNGLSAQLSTTSYAHMSIQTDAQLKADGTRDNRYIAKTRALPSRSGLVNANGAISAASTLGFNIWPTSTSSMATIRNEELIALRAEARLATGDKAGAIADLNTLRVNSGGLPASTLTAASSDDAVLTGILYEKRYSTLLEGLRWVDMRRYNKLSLLPLDVASGPNQSFVAKVIPVPQGECLVRAKSTGDLLGPGGQNNCAP